MSSELVVERLQTVTSEDAAGIGVLLQDLSERHDGQPVPLERLTAIVDSPDRDQFVARLHSRIVGCATLNLVMGSLGSKAWLEDFVVANTPDIRGCGVGYALWQELGTWCEERDVPLYFSSHPDRQEAHGFYKRQGAVATASTLFRFPA